MPSAADSSAEPLIGKLTAIAAEMRWACVRPEYEAVREQLLKLAMDIEQLIDELKSGH